MLIDSHYWKLLSRNMHARKSALIEREEVNGGSRRDNGDKLKEGRFQLTKEFSLKKKKTSPWDLSTLEVSQRGCIWRAGLDKALGSLGWISVVPALSRSLDQKSPDVPSNLNCSVLLWEMAGSWLLPFENKRPAFQVSISRSSAFQYK